MNKRSCGWIFLLGLTGLCTCLALGMVVLIGSPLLDLLELAPALQVGDPAPEFSLPGLAGGKVALSAFAGKPVLISLGATW